IRFLLFFFEPYELPVPCNSFLKRFPSWIFVAFVIKACGGGALPRRDGAKPRHHRIKFKRAGAMPASASPFPRANLFPQPRVADNPMRLDDLRPAKAKSRCS